MQAGKGIVRLVAAWRRVGGKSDGSNSDAASSSECGVGSGHTCGAWVTTLPTAERACVDYDGLAARCR